MSTMTLAAILLTFAPDDSSLREWVVVFRFTPAQPGPRARLQDDDRILKLLEDEFSYSCNGGMGRGYKVSIFRRDLGKWKEAIDKLIDNGVLQVYRWGTDKDGFGLIPVK